MSRPAASVAGRGTVEPRAQRRNVPGGEGEHAPDRQQGQPGGRRLLGQLERRAVAGRLHVRERGVVPHAVGVGEQVDVVADDRPSCSRGFSSCVAQSVAPYRVTGWWSQVWLAIVMPAASSARTSSRESQFGRSSTTVITKKVAGIPSRRRIGSAVRVLAARGVVEFAQLPGVLDRARAQPGVTRAQKAEERITSRRSCAGNRQSRSALPGCRRRRRSTSARVKAP